MNILLTSVGRRAYLVKYFKDVLGNNGKVFVSNSDDQTIAFHYADEFVVTPLIYEEKYILFLLEYCRKNKIQILLSLFDIDLLILSKHKREFLDIGTTIIVSDPSFIEICNDKWKTYNYLLENKFNVPKTYVSLQSILEAIKKKEISYPVIVKPRFGCGSIAMSVAEDEMALQYYYNRNERIINQSYLKYESSSVEDKILFQEFLNGQEFGADVINDLNGNYQVSNIKKKIAMRSGETDISEVVDNEVILSEVARLGKLTKHIGNLDCDVFLVGNKPYILELNARFGGGYPFSHIAGCNLPKAIIDWYNNRTVSISSLQAKPGIKAYKEIVITKV